MLFDLGDSIGRPRARPRRARCVSTALRASCPGMPQRRSRSQRQPRRPQPTLKAPSGGSGEGTASSSRTGRRVPDERSSAGPCSTRAGKASEAVRRARSPCRWGRRARRRARRCRSAGRAARPARRSARARSKTARERGQLGAEEGERRAVGEVGGVDAVRAQHALRRPRVLDRGEMRRYPRAAEDVARSARRRSRPVSRSSQVAGVRARARSMPDPCGQRQVLRDQREQPPVGLDHSLRASPGRVAAT